MTTAECIIIGMASVIALIGWLRWIGVAGGHDGEMQNKHPTGPPKYQRPLKGQNSEPQALPPKHEARHDQQSSAALEVAELPAEIRLRDAVSATTNGQLLSALPLVALAARVGIFLHKGDRREALASRREFMEKKMMMLAKPRG